jgi:hypothetical protein
VRRADTPDTPIATVGDNVPTAAMATRNLLIDYYGWLPRVIDHLGQDPEPVLDPDAFSPGFLLPELDEHVRRFLAVATAEWRPLADCAGTRLLLLDMTANPATNTTKTFASLLIVARAVEFIRRTGEPVIIFTPTSANKGVALRDAVERALAAGLASPDQLRIVMLAPARCRDKLRGSRLAIDPELRRRNPVLLYDGADPEGVKELGRRFVREHGRAVRARHGANLWFSLELRNYLIADAARALFEHDVARTAGARPRLHAHAVSSAYGLLGYSQGREVLEAAGLASPGDRPGFLLVQHLGAPDMVLSLHHGGFARERVPRFVLDPATGIFEQRQDPHFPATTYDPEEVLDPTFYTHEPATSPAMNALVSRFGGAGIVVSLHECLARYPLLRGWLQGTGRPLPLDPRTLREWSLVMAMTGVLNALDRGLIQAGHDVVVHGSGSYTTADYRPLDAEAITSVTTTDDIAAALREGD